MTLGEVVFAKKNVVTDLQWRLFMGKRFDCIRKNRIRGIQHDFDAFLAQKAPKARNNGGVCVKNATQCLAGIYGGETFLFGGRVMYYGGETFLFGRGPVMYNGGVCVKHATRMSCRHL